VASRLPCITLDVDSAPIKGEPARATGSSAAANVHQPKAEWNGHYSARIYHPLITRVAGTGDMLDARLRAGNVGTAPSRQIASQSPAHCPATHACMRERGAMDGALDVILDVVDRAQQSFCDVAMVRIDAGFPSAALLAGFEARDSRLMSRGCGPIRCWTGCGIMHIARRAMAAATGTGWSLRRLRERVLRAGAAAADLGARRMKLALSSAAAPFWSALWPRIRALHWADP